MKVYLLTTGTLFALIGGTHLASLVRHLPTPDWAFDGTLGALAAALALWAFRLVITSSRGAV
jgi:hypothetical protein